MNNEKNSVFREKNLKKAQDPEQLSSYLKVTGYKEWVIISAAALVLVAVFVWFFFGKITTVYSGAGYNSDGVLLCYFIREDTEELKDGAELDAEGTACAVMDVDTALYTAADIPNEVLYYLPESRWYSRVEADGHALADGLYRVSFSLDTEAPVAMLSNGG